MKPVQVLMLDSRLTVMTKKETARKVLEELRRQDVILAFDVEDGNRVYFTPVKDDEDHFTVWAPDRRIRTPMEFQPSIQMDEGDTVDELYRLRKYYNAHWRD